MGSKHGSAKSTSSCASNPAPIMEKNSYRRRLAEAPFKREEDAEIYAVPFEEWPSYKAQHPKVSRKYGTTLAELAGEKHQHTLQVGEVQYRLLVWRGSVCDLEVDAVQNAANGSLLGGGGVDGAIHDTAGPLITRECADRYEAVDTAGTVITKGYRLPANYVIHTVGPVYYHDQSNAPRLLATCYKRTFELCELHRLTSLGLCCISCGIYGYPPERAAYIAIGEAIDWCKAGKAYPQVFVFVTFNERETFAYRRAFAELLQDAPRLEHSLSADPNQDSPVLWSQASVPSSSTTEEKDMVMRESGPQDTPHTEDLDMKEGESVPVLQETATPKEEKVQEAAEEVVKIVGTEPNLDRKEGVPMLQETEVPKEGVQEEAAEVVKSVGAELSKPTQPTGDDSSPIS